MQNSKLCQEFIYRTRAIINRGLYILNLIFKAKKRLFKGHMYG